MRVREGVRETNCASAAEPISEVETVNGWVHRKEASALVPILRSKGSMTKMLPKLLLDRHEYVLLVAVEQCLSVAVSHINSIGRATR